MSGARKLKEYLHNNGIQKQWFAEQIGINKNLFYEILRTEKQLPQKYWKKIISLTKGKVGLKDLAELDRDEKESIDTKNYEN